MIYVSYYNNVVNIDKNIERYSISVGNGGYNFKKIKSFAPNWDLVQKWKKGLINWSEYENIFNAQLNKLDKDAIIKWFTNRNGVLLCYERDNKFCHRRLVMEFLLKIGLNCKEY